MSESVQLITASVDPNSHKESAQESNVPEESTQKMNNEPWVQRQHWEVPLKALRAKVKQEK